jgi:rifampin ADP-ribosylating transferase
VGEALDEGPFFHGAKADLHAGEYENDPNVTDKKFPGNPTRSYRSAEPLRVVGEVDDWTRLTPEALQQWRDRLAVLLADERGVIIN